MAPLDEGIGRYLRIGFGWPRNAMRSVAGVEEELMQGPQYHGPIDPSSSFLL